MLFLPLLFFSFFAFSLFLQPTFAFPVSFFDSSSFTLHLQAAFISLDSFSVLVLSLCCLSSPLSSLSLCRSLSQQPRSLSFHSLPSPLLSLSLCRSLSQQPTLVFSFRPSLSVLARSSPEFRIDPRTSSTTTIPPWVSTTCGPWYAKKGTTLPRPRYLISVTKAAQ